MSKRRCAYRKVYESHYGGIPTDQYGNTYHIHHINGDCTDNRIENLIALSAEDHYKLHLEQGDYGAAAMLANELGLNASELRRQATLKQIEDGNHISTRPDSLAKSSETKRKRFESGDNPYRTPELRRLRSIVRTRENNKLAAEGKHPSQSDEFKENISKRQKQAAQDGKIYSQSEQGKLELKERNARMMADGSHPSQRVYECPHCGKIGKGGAMKKYHMDACKHKQT